MKKEHPKPGDVFTVRYPFTKVKVELFDGEGPYTTDSWRPGVSIEQDYEDPSIWADSEGQMILTVVDVFKPGRFPTRVFYTRKFVGPDLGTFGKSKLHICTLEKFRRISTKYQVGYQTDETLEAAAERRADEQARIAA